MSSRQKLIDLSKSIPMGVGEARVYKHMLEKGAMTSLEAINAYGETRLGARIFTLKQKGVPIASRMVAVKNRFGERRYVKQYWLEHGDDETESLQNL